jgi:predicted enzyme related to lactoylglutathione lyase
VVQDPSRAGHGLVTVAVADLDQAITELAERGIRGAPPETVGSAGRKATVADPDGNTIALIEVAPADPAVPPSRHGTGTESA